MYVVFKELEIMSIGRNFVFIIICEFYCGGIIVIVVINEFYCCRKIVNGV